MRDAYLLSAACEAYAGKPVGKLVRIGNFVAVAAYFKTRADVDYYISGIKPETDDLHTTAKQLLLPPEVTELLIRIAHQSDNPRTAFHQLLHDDDVLELIFKNSFALRSRLMRYMTKELELEEGDTIILADTGYNGTTQEYLARTFKEKLKIDILGRYVASSDDPCRAANSKGLITSPWWNYRLFEQCCAVKEGVLVDYDLTIQAWLGHAQVATTHRYAAADVEMMRNGLEKAGVAGDHGVRFRPNDAVLQLLNSI
ncbi:hypothetical protein NKH75_28515 [Mesorhizobium sp. M0984]|uniref:hypothetical protein n=1 Tax=unclassified Mesorhizobium TaxID=325217 RepID=UPI00333BD822